MEELAPGLRILVRDEEWMIKKIDRNSFGNRTIYCTGISPLVRDKESVFLEDLEDDIMIINPANTKLVADTSSFFKKSKLYIESNLRQKIPTDFKIHIGHKAAMDLMDFQLVPTAMSLKSHRQRILIADSVGLGKTLESGILMSELIIRGKGKRILVVTVKSMMMQFQKEMWNRFSIPLIRLDSNKIQKIRNTLPSNYNPFFYYDKTIISIDTLKRDVEYRTHLENAYWDIIVIDEAHNVADRGMRQAQRAKLAQLLAGKSDTLILLSATPHDGKAESFASLMNMLDPTAIANPHDYSKEDIKGLCVRRFKKDVRNQIQTSFKERDVNIEKCNASNIEEMVYNYFVDMRLEMDEENKRATGQLFKTSLEKALFSSPAACIKSISERIKKLEKKYGNEFKDIKTLKELKELLEKVDKRFFSRYQKLIELLNSQDYNWKKENKDRIVIFTERIETMKWLSQNLRNDLCMNEEHIQEMYGGMSDIEQQKIVEDFGREESKIKILVASDVASEGINLHYLSHRLIHFDIPWSLMVFQQRNGRIDRYGQKEKPDIRYFLIQSSNAKIKGDSRIMEVLIQKEEQAYKNIGDPTLLMGKFNIEEEEQEVAQSIENNISSDEFEEKLESASEEFDPFELLMKSDEEDNTQTETYNDITLYTDKEYLLQSLAVFNERAEYVASELEIADSVEIELTDEMKRRLKSQVPDEVLPERNKLKLSSNKEFVMEEMNRCMQNDLSEEVWPQTQFLWGLHPIYNWINDKSKLLFGRGEAPVLGFKSESGEKIITYIISGSIFNRRSIPVIDEWYGVKVKNDSIIEILSIKDLLEKTKLGNKVIPNENILTEADLNIAQQRMNEAIEKVKEILSDNYKKYDDKMTEEVISYSDKIEDLKKKHLEYNQLSIFGDEQLSRTKQLKKNKIDEVFDSYWQWYEDSIRAENQPFIKVIAVLMEV